MKKEILKKMVAEGIFTESILEDGADSVIDTDYIVAVRINEDAQTTAMSKLENVNTNIKLVEDKIDACYHVIDNAKSVICTAESNMKMSIFKLQWQLDKHMSELADRDAKALDYITECDNTIKAQNDIIKSATAQIETYRADIETLKAQSDSIVEEIDTLKTQRKEIEYQKSTDNDNDTEINSISAIATEQNTATGTEIAEDADANQNVTTECKTEFVYFDSLEIQTEHLRTIDEERLYGTIEDILCQDDDDYGESWFKISDMYPHTWIIAGKLSEQAFNKIWNVSEKYGAKIFA